MFQNCLKLRDDLIFSQSGQADRGRYVVKDPRRQRFFQFQETERFIAAQLDGHTACEEVRRRVEDEFGGSLSASSLESFLTRLQRLGLLESATEQGFESRRARTRGSLLYLRWKALDPDALLDRLQVYVRWMFTPFFVALTAALVLLALTITIANYESLIIRLPALYRLDIFVIAWMVLLGVIACHEFAHALTCKHFGGQVREMGFMLIFFQPAMYCNVSDAWLLPQRRKRLWVTFAGAYFELFLWSLATLAWWISDPNTIFNLLALVVMLTSGIKTLINLNPLIKLDGYYLLSDWLDVPNLYPRAMNRVRSLFRRRGADQVQKRRENPRDRRILLSYGLLAWTFSTLLITWLLGSLGNYLTTRYQAAGFLGFSALTVAFFHRFTKSRPAADTTQRVVQNSKTPRRLTMAGAAVLIAVALFLIPMQLTISAPFTALPAQYAEVRAEVEGIVDQILVREEEHVDQGRLVARLSDRGWRSELDKINAEMAATAARLTMLTSGPRIEEVELARREVETAQVRWERAREQMETALRVQGERLARTNSSVEKAQAQLAAARSERDRIRKLVADGAGSQKELNDAESMVVVREKELAEVEGDVRVESADDLIQYRQAEKVAQMELREAQSRLDLLQAGARVELVDAARADLARLEAQREFYAGQIERLSVVSPIAGVVATPRLTELIGKRVDKGDLIVSVHDLSRMRAEIAVPEKEMADIAVGQEVVFKARAFPGRELRGTIQRIAPITSKHDDLIVGRAVLVTAEFDNPDQMLRSEMTGQCKIYCGRRPIMEILTRRILSYVRVEFWSWW